MIKNSIFYLKVVLDENGNIVDYFSNIKGLEYSKKYIKGKNWFDIFISKTDKDKIFNVFKNIIKKDDQNYKTYKNDLKTEDNRHLLIDFYNMLFTYKGKKYILSVGMEHLNADIKYLENLAKVEIKKYQN